MKKKKKTPDVSKSAPKSIQRLFVLIAATALAAAAIFGIFRMVGFAEPMDKLIVIASTIGIVIYTSYDAKDKFDRWKI